MSTHTLILIDRLLPEDLPEEPVITAVTLAELSVGPLVSDDAQERAARQALLQGDPKPASNRCPSTPAARAFGRVAASLRATRWVRFVVGEEVDSNYRQENRGRPGPNTRYRRIDRSRFTLSFSTDAAQVAIDAASDGCFPFVTNDKAMTPAQLLSSYKAQPHIERRHATFKGVLEAVPVQLKSDRRIDALGFCLYAALLVHALIERELRRAMAAAGITDLPLYYEDRACRAPTAARVLELLDPLARTVVVHHDRLLALQEPSLDPMQEQILQLLGVPTTPYGAA